MANKKRGSKKNRRGNNKPPKSGLTGFTVTKTIFPPMFRGVMTYDGVFVMGPAAGSFNAQVMRANSVYDPDFSGVGSTAAGYAQLAALYNRHRVMGGRCTARFVNNGTTPTTVVMAVNAVTTIGTSITQVLAQRFVWSRTMAGTSGSPSALEHSVSWDVAQVYGVPKLQVRNEDDFAGITGGNPNNGVFLHIGGYANGAAGGNYNLHVRMEYDVIWSLPLELSP